MIAVLHAWRAAGRIEAADLHFGALLARLAAAAGAGLLSQQAAALAGARVLSAARQGHVCLPLADLPSLAGTETGLEEVAAWRAALLGSGVVAPPGALAPLILDADGRLYLQRHQAAEQRVAQQLRQRAARRLTVQTTSLRQLLAQHFAGPHDLWPAVAAATAATRGLCVITGGPGSGKTYTVARLLRVLQDLSPQPLRVALAAPTGKAAARLDEALARHAAGDAPSWPRAQTLHRLLGASADGRFHHGPGRPLAVDVLVVDEASMVPLLLMDQLLAALPPQARLILAGDRDQLAAVEAGAVLAALCARSGPGAEWAQELTQWLGTSVPAGCPPSTSGTVADVVVVLRHSHRFDRDSGIGRLARAVLAGDAEAAWDVLRAAPPDLVWREGTGVAGLKAHWPAYEPIFRRVLEAARAGERAERVLAHWQALRVLAGPRDGPAGVTTINRSIERLLGVHGQPWYPGQPLLITRNDYELGLYNGDIGIVLPLSGRLRACFPGAEGTVRDFPLARLPAHETAWCLTVHKAQGSEYPRVWLLLPASDWPLLTREWLYTGLTRARQELHLLADADAVQAALARASRRQSGLDQYLNTVLEDGLMPGPTESS